MTAHLGEVTSVEFDLEGRYLLAGCKDNSNLLYDLRMVSPSLLLASLSIPFPSCRGRGWSLCILGTSFSISHLDPRNVACSPKKTRRRRRRLVQGLACAWTLPCFGILCGAAGFSLLTRTLPFPPAATQHLQVHGAPEHIQEHYPVQLCVAVERAHRRRVRGRRRVSVGTRGLARRLEHALPRR